MFPVTQAHGWSVELMRGSKLNKQFEEVSRTRIPMTQENLMSWTETV
jgi:hypothetical protein